MNGATRGPGGRRLEQCLRATHQREESPGSAQPRCRVTPGGPGNGFRDSATESRPPMAVVRLRIRSQARVKGCGKSAPRDRQRKRHGKPHREQDRIGTARPCDEQGQGMVDAPTVRVGCLSVSATARLEEWSPSSRKGMDRTRLTGPLAFSCGSEARFGWRFSAIPATWAPCRAPHGPTIGASPVGEAMAPRVRR